MLSVSSLASRNTLSSVVSTATIAYAVSVTGCGPDPITEGAAVLKHSIHRASIHGHGKYDYKLFAIYHPTAKSCAEPLQELGYNLLEREVFVKVEEIEGEFLREKIASNGCCGEKELIKLEAYTLTDYPIVVHLDLDVLVLKPLDELFDAMLEGTILAEASLQWPEKETPPLINAFYTVDYNMVYPGTKYKPVQGGFLVTRPDMDVYERFKSVVKEGDFRHGSGWGGKVGPFYGSMTFQGLIPYYYDVLDPGHSVELNRCVYNQMADNPRTGRTINDKVSGDCRTGEKECEDCRSRPLEHIHTIHFTLCQKPWLCITHDENMIQHRLCKKVTREWYAIRSEMEKSWGRSGRGDGKKEPDMFFGYCGPRYLPIEKPYGQVALISAGS